MILHWPWSTIAILCLLTPAILAEAEIRLIDPWDPPDEQERTSYPRQPGWAFVLHRSLAENSKAHLLASDPDIWLVPDLLDPEAADEIVEVARGRRKHRVKHPRWCFHASTFRIRERFPDIDTVLEDEGLECTDSHLVGSSIHAQMNRSVTEQFNIVAGEIPTIDSVAALLEREVGLPVGHTHHTEVIEYGRNQELVAHTDCKNATNDVSATALVYLTDVDAGGHTCFKRRGFCVMPRKGAGLFFTSLDSDLRCSMSAQHETTKVRAGSKIVLQRRYHSDLIVPSSEPDVILCRSDKHCRHSMVNQSRWKAATITQHGLDLLSEGKAKKAEAKLQAAIAVYPTYAKALLGYGELLYNAGKFKKTEKFVRDVFIEAPGWPDAHYLLGQTSLERGRYKGAAEHFKALVNATPQDESGWWLLASALAEIPGQEREASEALAKHLTMSPDDADALDLRNKLGVKLQMEL